MCDRRKKLLQLAKMAQIQREGAHLEGTQTGWGNSRMRLSVPYLKPEVAVQELAPAVAQIQAVFVHDPRQLGPETAVVATLDQACLEKQHVQRRIVGWAGAGEEALG